MRSPLRKIFATTFVLGRQAVSPSAPLKRSRMRMMLRHTWLLTTGMFLLTAGIVGAMLFVLSKPTVLTVAVGPESGEDAKLVQAMAQQFRRDKATVQLRPILSDGPIAAARALETGTADVAVVRRDLMMPKNGQAVAILRENVVVMMVPAPGSLAAGAQAQTAQSPQTEKQETETIEKIDNLAGRRIGVVSRDPGATAILQVILKQYEIAPDKVTLAILDPEDVKASLKANPVDAIFATGPVTARFISNAIAASSTAKAGPAFLPIGASEAIENRVPAYVSTELQAGIFGGPKPQPEETVETVSYSYYVVVRSALSESLAADLTKQMFAARQSLAAEFPAAAKIEKPDTDRDAAVPAHPGAAAYIDNEQNTFFDRYSDLLYWGIMLLSFVGSGFAWLTSYVKADERMRRMHVLDRLLDVLKSARAAATIEELDKLQADADDLLRKTVNQAEKNGLDEAALMAFTLALDQAQRAITDRRAQLGARPAEAAGGVTPLRIATP